MHSAADGLIDEMAGCHEEERLKDCKYKHQRHMTPRPLKAGVPDEADCELSAEFIV